MRASITALAILLCLQGAAFSFPEELCEHECFQGIELLESETDGVFGKRTICGRETAYINPRLVNDPCESVVIGDALRRWSGSAEGVQILKRIADRYPDSLVNVLTKVEISKHPLKDGGEYEWPLRIMTYIDIRHAGKGFSEIIMHRAMTDRKIGVNGGMGYLLYQDDSYMNNIMAFLLGRGFWIDELGITSNARDYYLMALFHGILFNARELLRESDIVLSEQELEMVLCNNIAFDALTDCAEEACRMVKQYFIITSEYLSHECDQLLRILQGGYDKLAVDMILYVQGHSLCGGFPFRELEHICRLEF